MATPFIGSVTMFAGNFAPLGYAFCDGRLVPISENDALFALIGTTSVSYTHLTLPTNREV